MLQLFQTTGLYAVTALRWSFDKVTRYGPEMTEAKWMTRVLFLETIAGAVLACRGVRSWGRCDGETIEASVINRAAQSLCSLLAGQHLSRC